MEAKNFIESGVLELYILDALNPQEKAEVEDIAIRYPEVASEIRQVESSFEAFAKAGEIEVAEGLKERIRSKLTFNSSIEEEEVEEEKRIRKIDPIQVLATEKRTIPGYSVKMYSYALAACFTLLIISCIGIYSLWNQLKETRKNYNELVSRSEQYGNQVTYFKGELRKSRALMNDPGFRKLPLPGIKAHAEALAVVWWNQKNHTVMIDPNGLPHTDSQHSYQLWAIIKGKPVNAGVFEVKGDLESVIQLKNIEGAQAFAVTLEPKGGSVSPTMSQMYVEASI